MIGARSSASSDCPAAERLIEAYLRDVMAAFRPAQPTLRDSVPDSVASRAGVRAERLFEVFTHREFCYLSRRGAAPYREQVLPWLMAAASRDEPISCYYDIGGGYHASVQPGISDLSFEAGLGELMILRQIARFSHLIARLHPPGIRFHLVVDNLCALLINDIPLANTLRFCSRLSTLIEETGMSRLVDVLVESELFSVDAFAERGPASDRSREPVTVGPKERENIERFLGRRCSDAEALDRARRYASIIHVSDALLADHIHGPHFTQRATAGTLCFRAFPGADSRIQCGQVVLNCGAGPRVQPILLTSANAHRFQCAEHRLPHVLPAVIRSVVSAAPQRFGEHAMAERAVDQARGSTRGAA